MKNKPIAFIVTLCWFVCLHLQTQAQKAFLPHFTTKDGLPSNNCFFTFQDKKGFLWIATDAGVSRFDGAVFENFSVDDGLPDNQILQLREDSKGRIWFMSLNGQLSFFFNGKIHNNSNDKTLKNLEFNGVVVSFLEDSSGKLWFGTNNNIIGHWDGTKTTKYSSENKNIKLQSSFLYEDANKNIYAISRANNLVFQNNKFVPIANANLPISYKVVSKKDGIIYFIDSKGLNSLHPNNSTALITKIDKKLLNNSLGYTYVDNNELWLCNNSGAIHLPINGNPKRFLEGISVNQVIKDAQQNVWFTTTNGLYKLPKSQDQIFLVNEEIGLHTKNFKSIARDNYNRIWLGSNDGIISILDLKNKKTVEIKLADKEKYNTIKQLRFDKKNKRVIFASDYGLGSVNSNYPAQKDFKFLRETNNNVFVIKNFTIDTTSKLTLSMSSGVVIINDRNRLEFSALAYKEDQDFFKNRSYRVFYDKQENLWFSNINGLSEFNHNKINKHYQKNPLLTKRINDMRQLQNGYIAMATDGYGILIFDKNKVVKQINHQQGLANNIATKIFARNNNLWTITNSGINKITIANKHITVSGFDDANGILSNEVNDLYIGQDTAYFATNNGLVYFTFNDSQNKTPSPKVYITSIINDDRVLDLGKNTFTFAPSNQNITINYSAIDFKNRNITYRYRLKNTSDWIETKNRRLELTGLEPGKYQFEVAAKSQNSNWSNSVNINLVLQKRWYQTWGFLAIAAALLGCVIYLVGVRITKQQKNKEQEQLLLKNKILMLEQQALQAMMNPHFVFNVMNSIQHYINTQNTNSANKVLTGFARLIRKNLEICTKSYISLAEELNYLNLYLNLEKNRFGEKFQFELIVDKAIDQEETFVPSMLLQPYIENAIWHGIMPNESGKVTIDVKLAPNDCLKISITDDGIGIDNSLANKTDGHISKGMDLTKERIALLNKIEAKSIQLNIKQNGKSGTTVTLLLPTKL